MNRRLFSWLLAAALAVFVTGCAYNPIFGDSVLKDARALFDSGQPQQSLAMLQRAMAEHPQAYVYRTEYFRERDISVVRWLAQADAMVIANQHEAAGQLYRLVQKYDPENLRAKAGLEQVEADIRHRKLIANAERLIKEGKYPEAEDALRTVLVEAPQNRDARRLQRAIEEQTVKPAITTPRLTASALKPITLELRDVPLRTVFDVISRAIGINFVFDKDVRTDQRTGLAIQDTPAEEVIRLLLTTNQLERKIVNDRTLLIYPNTPQKLREYQELVVKSFYIANADVRQTANMVRTLVKTRDIYVDEKLNLLIIKDTPNAVRLAERLVAAQHLADPEVLLEVEVLEVGVTKLLNLGMRWPFAVDASVGGAGSTPPGTGGRLTLNEVKNLNNNMVSFLITDPLLSLRLQQQDGSTSLLANPRIRVRNKGKAKIHIGDRVPVITTTAAATGGFVSENVSYIDVGLKLEVEPLIHLEDEVAINVALEVSNIADTVKGSNGNTLAYQIGTRNATTTLQLKDGETQVLAGLISDNDRRSADRVPGLGNFPVLGRLFSLTNDSTDKREIVLLITPHLIRTLARPDARTLEFAAGTEASTGGGAGVVPSLVPPPITPARPLTPSPGPGATAPGIPSRPGILTPQPGFPSANQGSSPTPIMPGAPSSPFGAPSSPTPTPTTQPPPPPTIPSPALPAPGQLVPFGGVKP
jgi:general secretion pathway protein D